MNPTATTPELRIGVRDLEAQDYLGKRLHADLGTVGQAVSQAFGELYERIEETGATPSGPPFTIPAEPAMGAIDIEVGAPCRVAPEPAPGQHRGRLEACAAAVAIHRGPYDEVGGVYSALFQWVGSHGYRPAGRPREVYLNGPDEVRSPADYVTEVVLPVSEIRR